MLSEKIKTIQSILNNSGTINLRNLGLESSEIASVMQILMQANTKQAVKSISFSYNPLIGNSGAAIIANNLPKNLSEIGLVGCGIGDAGGEELLNKIKELTQLTMLCIEQNIFSDSLKEAFKIFSKNNPQILVVI